MPGRALHVLTSDERRGAQTLGYQLHQALCGRGWESEIACLTGVGGSDGLPVPRLGRRRYGLTTLTRLRRRAAYVDVVVAHGSSTLLACGFALASSTVPFVYVNIGDPDYWWKGRFRRARVRWLLHRAAAVAAISDASRTLLVEEIGLAPDVVRVIPNGRSAEHFMPADPLRKEAMRRQLKVDTDVRAVVWLGALSREKRPDLAVEAIARLADIHLFVVGDGAERDMLLALADDLAPGRVHLLGSRSDVTDVLAASDVVLLTSDSEGVPGVLIEAGLMGLPSVATDVGFVRDVVVDGETGRVVPSQPDLLAAALRDVLNHASEMGEAARQRCLQRFEIQRVVDCWEDLLEAVRRRSA